MDTMRSQSNMTWVNMPSHHVTHIYLFIYFPVMDCNFFNTTCHDKNTHHTFKLLLLLVFGWIF
jgi:hypothetical protein